MVEGSILLSATFFKEDNHIFKELQINEQITCQEVRLIAADGEQLGIMSLESANELAHEKGLDLCCLNSSAKPAVCKLMDYGKYRYEQIKKEKEQRKNQKIVELKEIQLSLTIDKHDVEYRVKQAQKFLQGGDKIKLTLRMRGRQQAFVKNALDVVNNFASMIANESIIDKPAQVNGRNIIMIIAPKNK